MRRRTSVLAAGGLALAFALTLSQPALPQQVAAAPLSQVDSWGVGGLAASEASVPATFWSNTTGEALTPVFMALQARDLSPAGRALLRRIMLSKSKGPAGGNALVPERLRLIEQLGENAFSADLRKRYGDTDWGKSGDRLAIEMDLVGGQKESCSRVQGKPAADKTLMPLRAFCAALNSDFNAASLIGEQIADADESFGVWLLAAIENIREPTKTRPDGRYGSPFEAAVSVAAKLNVPAGAMNATSSDVAAAIALNTTATLEQRRAALRPALDGREIKASTVLAVLTKKDETPAPPQPKQSGRVQPPRPDLLAQALAMFADAEAKPDARAAAYAAALRSAETMSDARLVSTALGDAIKALPKTDATLPFAETFARAALFNGDTKQASDWRKQMASVPKEQLDAWALARLDLMFSFAGATNEKPGAILDRLIAAAPPPAQPEPGKAAAPAPKNPTPADKQLDLRRIENARVLFLYAGTGRDLSPAQRALLATQRAAGRGVSDAAIARISSAIDQNANGEAAVAIISLLGPDTSAISFAGLSDLLAQLRRIGFEKDADAIALESLQAWKGL
jgi:hypothetical protein